MDPGGLELMEGCEGFELAEGADDVGVARCGGVVETADGADEGLTLGDGEGAPFLTDCGGFAGLWLWLRTLWETC